ASRSRVGATENAALQAEVRALTGELLKAHARAAEAAACERRRVERELHDGAQNRIIALQIRLAWVLERAQDSAPELAEPLAELVEQAQAVWEDVRRVACGAVPWP